jgi:hypothetical protein
VDLVINACHDGLLNGSGQELTVLLDAVTRGDSNNA